MLEKLPTQRLRAPSMTAMSDQGFEARQIMFILGKRSKVSHKTYNHHLSDEHKCSANSCLSNFTNPNQNNNCKITNHSCRSSTM